MAIHTLKTVQKIPATLNDTWDFFSRPENLDTITPGDMAFRILTDFNDKEIYPGLILEYKVSPLLRIPLYWMTEISTVDQGRFFVDEQRKGPYSLWRHEHYFKEIEGGVEMWDIVRYRVPLGIIGELLNVMFIKRQLRKIFAFRYSKVEEIFGKWSGQNCSILIK